MDTLFNAPAPYNGDIAALFLQQGHWLSALLLVLLPLVILPSIRWMIKNATEKSIRMAEDKKRIVDLETEVRVQKRDQQIADLEAKWELKYTTQANNFQLQFTSQAHAIDEVNLKISNIQAMMERMFEKMDKIMER